MNWACSNFNLNLLSVVGTWKPSRKIKMSSKNCKIFSKPLWSIWEYFKTYPSLKLTVRPWTWAEIQKERFVSLRHQFSEQNVCFKEEYPHHLLHYHPSLGFYFAPQNTSTPRSIHHAQVFSVDLNTPKPEQQMGTTEVGFCKNNL